MNFCIKLLRLIFFSREHRFIMTVALANTYSIHSTALIETGDESFSKTETSRHKNVASNSTRHNCKRHHMSVSDSTSHFKSCSEVLNLFNPTLSKSYLAQHFYSIIQSDFQHTFSMQMYAKQVERVTCKQRLCFIVLHLS